MKPFASLPRSHAAPVPGQIVRSAAVLLVGSALAVMAPSASARFITPGAVTAGPFPSGAAVAHQAMRTNNERLEDAAKAGDPAAQAKLKERDQAKAKRKERISALFSRKKAPAGKR